MGKLPQRFLDRMSVRLGEEYDAFLACYGQEGFGGLRVNTQKISVREFLRISPFHLTPVPWTDNGFYYRKGEPVSRHPYYFAGLYYIQEPSAMLPASRLPARPGDAVLDLCAAPGGKATELSLRLEGGGLLVANDVSASRARALLKNLTVWGAANCCVTAETPQRLLESFGCFFDRILVDAPCSGEGMFRRDAALVRAWEKKGPEQYAGLQKEILACAVQMLKPDGHLVYSTCTFSEEENEAVICETLRRFPEMELVQPKLTEGFAPGYVPCESCIRLWPHRVDGEGHFMALLHRRPDGALPAAAGGSLNAIQNSGDIPQPVRAFLEQIPGRVWRHYTYRQLGEQCLLVPPFLLPEKLRYLRTGILAGTLKRGRFEPSQALAMLLDAGSFPYVVNFSAQDHRVIRYLKGETVELAPDEAHIPDGWTLVCTDGFALGWGKYANGSIKNKYDPGWRLQA